MRTVVARLDIAGEEFGLGGDLLHEASQGRGVVEQHLDFGPERPGGEQSGGNVGSDPGLGFFEEGDDGPAGGNEVTGAYGDGFDAGAGGGTDFDFGELHRDLGDFGVGLFNPGTGLSEFFRASAESSDGGCFFGLESTLLGGLDIFGAGAGLEQGDALACGIRTGAEGIPAAGGVVERLAGDIAGLGKGGEAGGGGGGGGEVGFGRAEIGLGLGNFLGARARFGGGERGAGLGGGGFGLRDFFRTEAPGKLFGAGGGFGEAGFGLTKAGAEFGKVEADERSFQVDDRAFFNQDLGDAAADLRADFDAPGFNDSIYSERGDWTVGEPPPAGGGGDRNEKERQAAGDHLPKGYSKR